MASSKSSTSSSSSVQTRGWTYDVFLSFRGEDTRYTFVDHLYAALVRSGLTVFKDDKMLRVGKEISPELLEAIEGSTCAVVVLSKNYANSSWCLVELAKIMECQIQKGQLVIPVFYHVDPSDVRRQKRDFETAFRQHEEKSWEEMDEVNEWREALTAVSKLCGHHISETATEGESAFTNKIVQEILATIQPRGMEKNLIGIESRINDLNLLLFTEATQEVRMLGICGMGGIGKTTIAQALFRRIYYKFEGSSFVKDVRENSSSKSDICALQEKILKDMTHQDSKIKDPEEGAAMIENTFCNKKVLLVLDDVDDVKQLEFLAAAHEWFGAGSRIIITSRDEHLLLDTNVIYKPAFLLKEQAVELFSRHAFRKNHPPERYEDLSNRAILYTHGLPLALKVLGSFFHGRQTSVWDSALKRLAKKLDKVIFETLKISFDGLEVSEKKIFLDITCFFRGHSEEQVTRILDSFGFDPVIGISVLIEKSLITVSNKRIYMHDLIQEMGLEIVREIYPNSRLWRPEEIRNFIKNNRELEVVEAIVFGYHIHVGEGMSKLTDFSADVFESMRNIRLLSIRRGFTSCKPTTLPVELQSLRWDDYPFSSLPVANLCKLVDLNMAGGEIEHLWIGYKFMPNLRFIRLEHLRRIESLPDVSGAPNVESLILSYCSNLVEVHESVGTLRKLAYLKVSDCWELKYLPSLIEMHLLETIDLSSCVRLEKFPEVSLGMEKLSNIYLNGCLDLKIIPSSVCGLKNLKRLHLQNCLKLQLLPEELGSVEKLEELQLGLEDYTMAFPWLTDPINFRTLTKLCCLRILDLSWRQIEEQDFPNSFHAFSSLEKLHLCGNCKLVQLPAIISRLSRLKHLELNDCQQLQSIQGLPSGIQVLKASNCRALQKIEELTEEYVWLHKIFLPGCETLLEKEENERCLDKMLQQSFLKECVAVDRQLTIWIPGRKIPSWFKEQHHGRRIALKLPPKRHTSIMGFTVCAVFEGRWRTTYDNNSIIYRTKDNGTVLIVYIPVSVFEQQMYDTFDAFERDDWSLFVEGGRGISIDVMSPLKVVRCGAHIMYKEEMESIQQIETDISDYRNSDELFHCGKEYIYRIKFGVRSIGP